MMNENVTLKELLKDSSKINELSKIRQENMINTINSKMKQISCYIDEVHPSLIDLIRIITEGLL